MTAEEILNTSDLLIKSDCVIIDGKLYECCRPDGKLYTELCYRYFITDDHYDYLDFDFRPEDGVMIERLDKHFFSK